MSFYRRWFLRSLRLAPVVGIVAAGWYAWGVFARYHEERDALIKSEVTYACAAKLPKESLDARRNQYGNVNVRDICIADRDFFVADYELEAVRAGTMSFEPTWSPFDWRGAAVVGLMWMMGTVLVAACSLAAVAIARWVWGKV